MRFIGSWVRWSSSCGVVCCCKEKRPRLTPFFFFVTFNVILALTGFLVFIPTSHHRATLAIVVCLISVCALNYVKPHLSATVFWCEEMAFILTTCKFLVPLILAGGDERGDKSLMGWVLITIDVAFSVGSLVVLLAILFIIRSGAHHSSPVKNNAVAIQPTSTSKHARTATPARRVMSFKPELMKKIVTQAQAKKTQKIYADSSQLRQQKVNQRLTKSQSRLQMRLNRRASKGPGGGKTARSTDMVCIHTLFQLVDKNSDGKVTKTELLTAVMRRRMREPELDAAFRLLGEKFTQARQLFRPKTAKSAIDLMNTDQDNVLTEEEMLRYCVGGSVGGVPPSSKVDTATASTAAALSASKHDTLLLSTPSTTTVQPGDCTKARLWLHQRGKKKVESILSRIQVEKGGTTRILSTAKVSALLSKCNRAPVLEADLCGVIGASVVTIDTVMAWVFEGEDGERKGENGEKAKKETQQEETDAIGFEQVKLRRTSSKRRKGIGNPSKVFKECDSNGNGTLEPNEVKLALQALGSSMTGEEFQVQWTKMDKNKDGSLSFQEFQKVLYHRIIFAALDADCTGYLDTTEIREAFTVLFNKTLSNEEFDTVYQLMDKNGDGTVNFKEFKNFHSKHKKKYIKKPS